MFDGTSRMGELIESSDSEIVIETRQLGVVRVPKYLVKGMSNLAAREYNQLVQAFQGREMALNPQSSRYFFAPSGIQLRQGDGYFQSNIALNSVSFGVTENITIGGLLSFLGAGGSVKIESQYLRIIRRHRLHGLLRQFGSAHWVGVCQHDVGIGGPQHHRKHWYRHQN
jgi:sugar-specific transcriptional regulator TrmB